MLPLQDFLKGGGNVDDLYIKRYAHPNRLFYGYKYTPDSPKLNPICENARGIVFDSEHNLIMKAFNRFYNVGQYENNVFDWNNCWAESKEDGSIIITKGDLVNTSGGFGYTSLPWPIKEGRTFRDLFLEVFPHLNRLDPQLTYAWELMSIENKVVQIHTVPTVKLLSVFEGENELGPYVRATEAVRLKVKIPDIFEFKSLEDAHKLMDKLAKKIQFFEGFVYRDNNNNRQKDKHEDYRDAHQAGTGEISKTRIITRILEDDVEFILKNFPERMAYIKPYEDAINEIIEKVNGIYSQVKHIQNQKEFALAIKHHKFSGLLFRMRQTGDGVKTLLLDNLSYAEKLIL